MRLLQPLVRRDILVLGYLQEFPQIGVDSKGGVSMIQGILIALCVTFAILFLYVEYVKKYVAAVVLKGLASLCFVVIGVFLSRASQSPKITDMIVAGLVVGCIADILLNLRFVFEKKGQLIFLVGILVFLAGHILYLIAVFPLSAFKIVSVIAGVVLTTALMIWILGRITAKPAFKAFGVVYLGAIMLLNCVAISNVISAPSFFAIIFAVGAILFLVSDILLILNTFGGKFRQSLRNLNIGLYYAGQIFIALSMSGFVSVP